MLKMWPLMLLDVGDHLAPDLKAGLQGKGGIGLGRRIEFLDDLAAASLGVYQARRVGLCTCDVRAGRALRAHQGHPGQGLV
jgi:hypothetical protein